MPSAQATVRSVSCAVSKSSDQYIQELALSAASTEEVPPGDWFCWSCCLQLKQAFMHPKTRVCMHMFCNNHSRDHRDLQAAYTYHYTCSLSPACSQFCQELGSTVYVAIDDRLDTFHQAKLERLSGDHCNVSYTEVTNLFTACLAMQLCTRSIHYSVTQRVR